MDCDECEICKYEDFEEYIKIGNNKVCVFCGKYFSLENNIPIIKEDTNGNKQYCEKKTKSHKEENYCEICEEETLMIPSRGAKTCELCGTSIYAAISDEAEWNNYKNDDGSFKTGQARACTYESHDPFASEHQTFVSVVTSKQRNKGYYNNSMINRMNAYNHKQKSYHNVKDIIESHTIEKYSQATINTACLLWESIMKADKVTRGGVRKGLIACCVYYATIHNGGTKPPLQVCKDMKMDDTSLFVKGDKEFKEVFENDPRWKHLVNKTTKSDDLFTSFCNKLNMEHKFIKLCRDLHKKHKKKLSRVIPKSATAGVIYYIIKEYNLLITKETVSKEFMVCGPTLVKTYKLIQKEENKKKKMIIP